MKKIEKELKSYFIKNLAHTDQLDSIKEKTVFFTNKSRVSFLSRSSFAFCMSAVVIVAASVFATIIISSLSSNSEITISPINNRLKKSIIKFDFNPSFTITIDEKGIVNSFYGVNNEGKIVLLNENLKDNTYEVTISRIIKIEKDLGYLLPNKNQDYRITIYNENKNDINDLQDSLKSYCNKLNLNTNFIIKDSQNFAELVQGKIFDSFDESYNYLYSYYLKNEESITDDYEEFNNLFNQYSEQIVYYKTASEKLNNSYLNDLIDEANRKFEKYMNSYFNNFIRNESSYQTYFNKLLDYKSEFLIAQSENRDTLEIEDKIDKCLKSLTSYKEWITNTLLIPNLDNLNKSIEELLNYSNGNFEIEEDDQFNENRLRVFNDMRNDFLQKINFSENRLATYNNLIEKKNSLIRNISK